MSYRFLVNNNKTPQADHLHKEKRILKYPKVSIESRAKEMLTNLRSIRRSKKSERESIVQLYKTAQQILSELAITRPYKIKNNEAVSGQRDEWDHLKNIAWSIIEYCTAKLEK